MRSTLIQFKLNSSSNSNKIYFLKLDMINKNNYEKVKILRSIAFDFYISFAFYHYA